MIKTKRGEKSGEQPPEKKEVIKMTEVTLFSGEEVRFNESEIFHYQTEDLDYEEAVVTEDGTLIAYDEGVCDWVRLGRGDNL